MIRLAESSSASRADVASAIHLSPRQLGRLFHRYFSMNPAQYYMNLRLRRARELLMHSSLPVMQITMASGFHSSSHFCKAYRDLFGHPPSDERRRLVKATPTKASPTPVPDRPAAHAVHVV